MDGSWVKIIFSTGLSRRHWRVLKALSDEMVDYVSAVLKYDYISFFDVHYENGTITTNYKSDQDVYARKFAEEIVEACGEFCEAYGINLEYALA